MKKRGKLVLVEWLDSHYRAGWTTDAPDPKPLKCVSVGWLVSKTKRGIVVAPHITREDTQQRAGEMTIPRAAIVRIQRINA